MAPSSQGKFFDNRFILPTYTRDGPWAGLSLLPPFEEAGWCGGAGGVRLGGRLGTLAPALPSVQADRSSAMAELITSSATPCRLESSGSSLPLLGILWLLPSRVNPEFSERNGGLLPSYGLFFLNPLEPPPAPRLFMDVPHRPHLSRKPRSPIPSSIEYVAG